MAEIPAFGGHFGAHVIPAASPPIIESPGAPLQAPGGEACMGDVGWGLKVGKNLGYNFWSECRNVKRKVVIDRRPAQMCWAAKSSL